MNAPSSLPLPPKVPARWGWYYRRLSAMRDDLQAEYAAHLAAAAQPSAPLSVDSADSAADGSDHDMTLGMMTHEQNRLREVEAAIQRIFDGRYGICEETGRPIPGTRLRAVPWTRHVREVEERLEHEKLAALSGAAAS